MVCNLIVDHNGMIFKTVHSTAVFKNNIEIQLVTRDKERLMELRPEWMGASLLKQRNQSDFSLANEYHGYNWEDRHSG